MHSQDQFDRFIVGTIYYAAIIVLLSVIPTQAQNPVPPTAREAAASPAFASKLHPSTRPAMNKPRAAARTRSGQPLPEDQLLYENGPVNGTDNAWTINFGYIVSDTFVPEYGPQVYGFDIYVWEFPGDTMSSLQWSITSQPNGGTVYGSGTVSRNGATLTDTFISTNQYGYDIDEVSGFGLNGNVTPGNTYWFNLFNATVPSGDPVYWDENSGKGCNSRGCPSQAYESGLGTIPSEAFDINGCDECPPPPPTCYGSGGKFQIIHNFTQQEVGTRGPTGGVTIDQAGNLYGTTSSGGVNSQGLAYELSPKGQGWVLNPLYSFLGGSGGSGPSPVILGPNEALYGTASGGLGNGLVFSLRPAPTACLTALCSWVESLLYEPTGDNNASNPGNLVADQAGNLYGTAGPGAYGNGAIFELTPSPGGWTETILYSFTGGSDGANPNSLLVGNDGNLYGTTHGGTVFRLAPAGNSWTETVLYNFQGTPNDGGGPGNLIQDGAGNLYGTSCFRCDAGGDVFVIVFMLSPSNGTWVFGQVWQQGQDTGVGGQQGINNLTIDPAGNLYGTAGFDLYYGGGYGHLAYIFKLVPEGSVWQFIYLDDFGSSWFNSAGPLALDAQGDLYGTSFYRGECNDGTVWKISP